MKTQAATLESGTGEDHQTLGSSAITRSRDGSKILSLGDDLKSAATDSLKKSATLLGVALHLYSENGTAPSPSTVTRRGPALVRDGKDTTRGGSENGSLTRSQLRANHAIARRLD